MWANLSLEGKVDSSSATPSSSLLKLDNGKVFPAAMVTDNETKGDGLIAPGFKPGGLLFDPEINIHGNPSTQPPTDGMDKTSSGKRMSSATW